MSSHFHSPAQWILRKLVQQTIFCMGLRVGQAAVREGTNGLFRLGIPKTTTACSFALKYFPAISWWLLTVLQNLFQQQRMAGNLLRAFSKLWFSDPGLPVFFTQLQRLKSVRGNRTNVKQHGNRKSQDKTVLVGPEHLERISSHYTEEWKIFLCNLERIWQH